MSATETILRNQARASLWLGCAWFIKSPMNNTVFYNTIEFAVLYKVKGLKD